MNQLIACSISTVGSGGRFPINNLKVASRFASLHTEERRVMQRVAELKKGCVCACVCAWCLALLLSKGAPFSLPCRVVYPHHALGINVIISIAHQMPSAQTSIRSKRNDIRNKFRWAIHVSSSHPRSAQTRTRHIHQLHTWGASGHATHSCKSRMSLSAFFRDPSEI